MSEIRTLDDMRYTMRHASILSVRTLVNDNHILMRALELACISETENEREARDWMNDFIAQAQEGDGS